MNIVPYKLFTITCVVVVMQSLLSFCIKFSDNLWIRKTYMRNTTRHTHNVDYATMLKVPTITRTSRCNPSDSLVQFSASNVMRKTKSNL